MRYKFYVDFGGFQKEISVLHKPLNFSWARYNDKISYNFTKSLDTELIFVDDNKNEDTNNKIWESYTYVKSLLDSSTSKLNISVYLADSDTFFWRGSIQLHSENADAWDLNKKVFKAKAVEVSSLSNLDFLGDIDVNIQGVPNKITCTDYQATQYNNGMTIKSVFDYIFSEIGIGWESADNILPILSTVGIEDIIIYDKSDAKRPTSAQSATITNIKLNTLIENVCYLFNVKFELINNIFSFKHYTERDPDIVDIQEKIKGEYNNSFSFVSIPQIETLKAEEANTQGFKEQTVKYDIQNDKKESYKLNDLCVDLKFIISNRDQLVSDPEAKDNISDTGVFFGAVNGLVIDEDKLSYDALFPQLWQGDRYLPRYSINNSSIEYIPTDRKIKEMKFVLDFFNDFNPVFLQGTKYGDGEVSKAVLANNKLTLTLHL